MSQAEKVFVGGEASEQEASSQPTDEQGQFKVFQMYSLPAPFKNLFLVPFFFFNLETKLLYYSPL